MTHPAKRMGREMAMEMAPVSVVIPCYRCADTIGRAVESITKQTLPPREILLVDDCSGDDGRTLAALHDLQRCNPDSGIRVVALEKNGGPSVARNTGWDMAAQPYVAFLDADDTWHPEKIAIQFSWLSSHPEVAFCGHLITVRASGDDAAAPAGEMTASKIGRRAWLLSCQFSTISVMLRRELPFRFNPDKRYAEDYLLWLQLALSGYDSWRIESVLAYCFKPLYGAGGLTGKLWPVEKGELDTYARVYREHLISHVAYAALVVFSIVKYSRRVFLKYFRGAFSAGARK